MATIKLNPGEALINAAIDGGVAWLTLPGNYERLAPAVTWMIEKGVSSWEAAKAAAEAVDLSGGSVDLSGGAD